MVTLETRVKQAKCFIRENRQRVDFETLSSRDSNMEDVTSDEENSLSKVKRVDASRLSMKEKR